jgi:hypothetical protein
LELDPQFTYTQRLKQVTLGYKKNETVQSSLATAITPARRVFVEKEYRTHPEYDGAVGTLFPESLSEEQINTCISNQPHAQQLARKRLAFFRTVHPVIRETFDVLPLVLDLGDELSYQSNLKTASGGMQYRYQIGQYAPIWIITRMEERHLMGAGGKSRVTVELMQ